MLEMSLATEYKRQVENQMASRWGLTRTQVFHIKLEGEQQEW